MLFSKENIFTLVFTGLVMTAAAGIRGLGRELSESAGRVSKKVVAGSYDVLKPDPRHQVRHVHSRNSRIINTTFTTNKAIWVMTNNLPNYEEIAEGSNRLKHEYQIKRFQQQIKKLPLYVDLRIYDNPIQTQEGPTCTAFATIAAIENKLNSATGMRTKLSEASLWSIYQKPSTIRAIKSAAGDSRSFISISTIDEVPMESNDLTVILDLPAARLSLKGTDEILEHLALQNPVVLGSKVNESYKNTKNGWIFSDSPSSNTGHAVTVVGYRLFPHAPLQSYFIIRNSWGLNWGDHGYGYLPLNYCEKHDCFAHAITKVKLLNINDLPDPGPTIR